MKEDLKDAINTLKPREPKDKNIIIGIKQPKQQKVKVSRVEKMFLPVMKAWYWMRGKKRVAGILIGGAGYFVPDPILGAIMKYIGGALLGVGVTDAALRKQTKYGEAGTFGKQELFTLLQDIWTLVQRLITSLRRAK